MKGKYVNTVIMMAAKSGRRNANANNAAETLAQTGDHKLIWSKDRRDAVNRLEKARTQEALSC